MSKSLDPGHFFQSDASEANRARKDAKSKNKNGNPIVLQSKILNAIPDPFNESCVYIAESAGCVRRVNVETKSFKTVYRGPTAPLTSVAIGGVGSSIVYAGCWDRDIWSWDRETKALSKKLKGHTDFVKTIITSKLNGTDILISGGADSKIMVWATKTGEKLHVIQDKDSTMSAVQNLSIDPYESTTSNITLVSSSSDPVIRRWHIYALAGNKIMHEAPSSLSSQGRNSRGIIRENETSVYQILFSGDDEDSDLWTCSADGTAMCLSRASNWVAQEIYEHGDYVRAVAVTDDWVVTAGRNEDINVWSRATGKLWHIYEGHFDEVTGLVVIEKGKRIVSVGIDGTVRVWELGKKELEKEIEKRRLGDSHQEAVPTIPSLMTAEEEDEIAELMNSD
ncbi:BgTH12-01168 [Blumeria graminis f. sp. triticale]|uniref:BgTH12-01168 n=1 Tax=Blumeria graminis f. sp. triticale TaxID=1689686 RepID=A0A9W4D7N4_BLUGR|nr:BgTH12-01168 [Blumeria graminis f. sp. triticale]